MGERIADFVQLEVHSPYPMHQPRFAVVERIAGFISARGSLDISSDFDQGFAVRAKELIGSAAE